MLATGRLDSDQIGYAAMRKTVLRRPDRVWAVEGSNGAGRPLAQRLLARRRAQRRRAGQTLGTGTAVAD